MIKAIKDWFKNKSDDSSVEKYIDSSESLTEGQQSILDMVSTARVRISEIYGESNSEKLNREDLTRQAISGEHNQVFKKALVLCIKKRRASIPVLQQGLDVGYEDALALLNKMTEQGLIGKARGERPRLLMNLAFETVGLWNAQGELDSEELGGETKRDEKYSEAVRIVIEMGRASTSVLQRRLRIGYGRAASIIDMMHREGIVGPEDGSKPRAVLVKADFLDRLDQIHDEGENW